MRPRRRRLRLCVLVLVVIGLVAASCSSDSGTPETSADSPGEVEAESLVDPLLELSNGDVGAAGAALLISIDRGYQFDVVAAAVEDDRFTLDGIVVDGSGGHLAPSGTDLGYVIDKAPLEPSDAGALSKYRPPPVAPNAVLVAFFQRPSMNQDEIQDLINQEEERNNDVLAEIAKLLFIGFTPEQVATAFIFGDQLSCPLGADSDECTLDGEPPLLNPFLTAERSSTGGDDSTTITTAASEDSESAATGTLLSSLPEGVYSTSTDVSASTETVLDRQFDFEIRDGAPRAHFYFRFESVFEDCLTTFSTEWTSTEVLAVGPDSISLRGDLVQYGPITVSNCGNTALAAEGPNPPYDIDVTFRLEDGDRLLVGKLGNEQGIAEIPG